MSITREEKKKRTRKAILEAAIELFSEKGFEKTSIAELARVAGVGKGTVYSYFRTKTDILHAFCEDELDYIHEQVVRNRDRDRGILDQMVTMFVAEFEYVTRNPEFGRIMMQEMIFPRRESAQHHAEQENRYFELIFPMIESAQGRGELDPGLEKLHICGHFFGLYLVVIHAWYTELIPTEEAEQALRTLFDQAIRGLAPATVTNDK